MAGKPRRKKQAGRGKKQRNPYSKLSPSRQVQRWAQEFKKLRGHVFNFVSKGGLNFFLYKGQRFDIITNAESVFDIAHITVFTTPRGGKISLPVCELIIEELGNAQFKIRGYPPLSQNIG